MPNKFDKKYRVFVTNAEPREVHNSIQGKICYPAYFRVGERGWFLCEIFESVHRIHTSYVRNIKYTDNGFVVHTANTKYEFEEIIAD